MEPQQLVKLAIVASIFLIVLSIGLHARVENLQLLFRHPQLVLKAFVALYVIVPLTTWGVTELLALPPPGQAVLLALSFSPIPPMLPNRGGKTEARAEYIIALQLFSALVSLLLVPLMLALTVPDVSKGAALRDSNIIAVLLLTIALPLGIGMAAHRYAQPQAERYARVIGKAGFALLIPALLLALVSLWPEIIGALSWRLVFAILLIGGVAMLAGHLLGGPEAANRPALALASVSRHPGFAIGVAGVAVPALEPQAIATTLIAFVLAIAIAIPYVRAHARRQMAGGQ